MLTTTRALTGRPGALRQPWLLALLVLGIVGMHGLVLGGGTGAGHHSVAPPLTAVAPVDHATSHDHAAAPVAGSPAASPFAVQGVDSSATALCMALLLALALGVAGVRRTSWVSLLGRLTPRVALPPAPVLRDRTPVPRFTVMRC